MNGPTPPVLAVSMDLGFYFAAIVLTSVLVWQSTQRDHPNYWLFRQTNLRGYLPFSTLAQS